MRATVTHFASHRSTLAHEIALRADRHGDRMAVSFSPDGTTWSQHTYAELVGRAAAVSRLLRTLRRPGGDPQFVLIMLPNGLDYVASFYGCLFGGAVAVPFYPPAIMTTRTARTFGERLRQIMKDCHPSVIVLPAALVEFVRSELAGAGLAGAGPVGGTTLIAAEDLPAAPEQSEAGQFQAGTVDRIDARPGDLALLQYTSGSTRQPKGVMVSHANLVHNVTAIGARLGSADWRCVATWLPLFHDLGLIGSLCHPLFVGMGVHLTTPVAFVKRPFLWMEMASRFRASLIMGPNFAYDLCVRWVTEEQRETLDLSELRCAVNAAEPVRHTTMDAFIKAYERHGLRSTTMVPAYGMAEATLCVTVPEVASEPALLEVSAARLRQDGIAVPADHEPTTVLVGCGNDVADTETVVVDPRLSRACPESTVGEVWVTGPSVAQGYWGLPESSEQTFTAELPGDGRQFLRTGDLGVKRDGVLYIVGRIKDVIIQHGVNHSPQDVEYTAEQAHPSMRSAGAAVFTVPTDDGDGSGEQVVLLCELEHYGNPAERAAILRTIRAAVMEDHGLELAVVALVRKGQIPKTTSGKVRRAASAQRWLGGGFDIVAAWPPPAER